MATTQAGVLSETQKLQNWRTSYLWLASCSYFFQGFYFLGTRIYVLAMMANWELLTETQATVLAVVSLPGYLKPLPGLLSDRIPVGRWGRRKPYLFLGGLLHIPSYLLLIAIKDFGPPWVASILVILFAWLLADTALDALVVDVTPAERTGQMQGSAQSSRFIGAIIGTLFVPLLGPRIGWAPVLALLACGALAQSGASLLVRESPVSRENLKNELPLKWVLREAFRHSTVWLGLLFILFFSTMKGTLNLISIFLLSELGWSGGPGTMQTFAVADILSTIASALGAFWIGRRSPKTLTSFRLYAGFLIAFWVLALPWLLVYRFPDNLTLVFFANISIGVGWGIHSVLVLALAMRVCPKSIEGFTFALMVSASSFGSLVIGLRTASAFASRLGGVIPALFTLVPYGLISLIFLYPLLRSMDRATHEIKISVDGPEGQPQA